MLTDRDVALAVANNPDLANRAVADFMSKDLSVEPDASIEEVATILVDRGPPPARRRRCRSAPGHRCLGQLGPPHVPGGPAASWTVGEGT